MEASINALAFGTLHASELQPSVVTCKHALRQPAPLTLPFTHWCAISSYTPLHRSGNASARLQDASPTDPQQEGLFGLFGIGGTDKPIWRWMPHSLVKNPCCERVVRIRGYI